MDTINDCLEDWTEEFSGRGSCRLAVDEMAINPTFTRMEKSFDSIFLDCLPIYSSVLLSSIGSGRNS